MPDSTAPRFDLKPGYQPEVAPTPPTAAPLAGEAGGTGEAAPKASGSPAGAQGGTPPTPTDAKVSITLEGGVVREIPMSELARLVVDQEGIARTREEADEILQRNASVAALSKAIESMDDDIRARVFDILQNPTQLREQRRAPPTDPHTLQRQPASTPNPEVDARIAKLEEDNRLLTGFLKNELAGRQAQTTAARIAEEMNGFPVFKENAEGTQYAKEAIATEVAATPKGDLRAIVAKHAAALHKMMQGARAPTRSADPRSEAGGPLPAPTKPFTGDDLTSGGIAQALIAGLFSGRR